MGPSIPWGIFRFPFLSSESGRFQAPVLVDTGMGGGEGTPVTVRLYFLFLNHKVCKCLPGYIQPVVIVLVDLFFAANPLIT